MNEIENYSYVRNVMTVTSVLNIEREKWGNNIILREFDDGVYICTCSVQSAQYQYKTKNAFVYDINFKPLH